MVQEREFLLSTRPTGVITAAVPQAKTSVIFPDAQSSRHCATEIVSSVAGMPRSPARVSSESRVTPGNKVPVSLGVATRAFSPDP